MKGSVQSADHRTARFGTDVNITGHQTRTEPKDYMGLTTCNKDQDTKGEEGVGHKQSN